MKHIVLIVFCCVGSLTWSQSIKSGNYLSTSFDSSESIYFYNDSLFQYSSSSQNLSEFGTGTFKVEGKRLQLFFDDFEIEQGQASIKKTKTTELEEDSILLEFTILDVVTKEPLPFERLRIQSETNSFQLETDFDGKASIRLPKQESSWKIETFSVDYEKQLFDIEADGSYTIEMEIPQKEETRVRDDVREFYIVKAKSRGITLKSHGVTKFYKLTF